MNNTQELMEYQVAKMNQMMTTMEQMVQKMDFLSQKLEMMNLMAQKIDLLTQKIDAMNARLGQPQISPLQQQSVTDPSEYNPLSNPIELGETLTDFQAESTNSESLNEGLIL